MLKDTKYLLAYILPLSAFFGLYYGGIWSFAAVFLGFLIIPLLELVLPQSTENFDVETEELKLQSFFFDFLLYLNIPILYGLVWYFFQIIQQGGLSTFEQIGMVLSTGLILGSIGINVAHELGHRKSPLAQLASQSLLLPSLYLHFNIEHNYGHNKNVATDKDPASSRKGESIYAFWWRSVLGCYRNAWALESKRLKSKKQNFWSWNNQMLRFQITQIIYLASIAWLFGPSALPFALLIAVGGFTLLESVNYIEHYGLRRKKMPSGRYETVSPRHSWNSNHELGRIMLYELTRHSDHHFKASRKYQVLRHIDESPQLPYGYPGSIVLALCPPIWFKLMDQEVEKWRSIHG